MKQTFTASVRQEGERVVAQCLEVEDIASQGGTEEEALDNLREELVLRFNSPTAIEYPDVQRIEAETSAT